MKGCVPSALPSKMLEPSQARSVATQLYDAVERGSTVVAPERFVEVDSSSAAMLHADSMATATGRFPL